MGALANGTLLDERYELLEPLDRGGMATVYRALDRRLDRPVAIKVLDDARRDEAGIAFREDRVTARLAHPHIVSVYDGGTTPGGQPFLVMELIDGQPISQLAPLSVGQALRIAEDIAGAVAYTHERGVVHCDIKPQNVLLDGLGRAKLADFGVASADHTPTGRIVYGSAPYLAPERLRGAPVGPAVDIYAIGATLYYLLSGQPPHDGASTDEVIARVQSEPPRPLAALAPGIPPAAEAIVRRAMAPDPADRYPTAAALCDDLAEVRRASGETTSALRVIPSPTAPPAMPPELPPNLQLTTELPDAATATIAPPPAQVTTTVLPAAPAPTATDADGAAESSPALAKRPAAGAGAAGKGVSRLAAWAGRPGRALPGRLAAFGEAIDARASAAARSSAPWRARTARRTGDVARAWRLWLAPAVAAVLIVLVIVAGVRTLADRRSPTASAGGTVEVPSLVGVGLGEARDRLVVRGLAVGRVDAAPLPGLPPNVIVHQDPPAGERVAAGTAVDLVIRTVP